MDFKTFLEKTRKSSGEKFLPKTINLYNSVIERHQKKFDEVNNEVDKLIEYMNTIIKTNRNLYIKSSFKWYLEFIGVDEEDDRLKKLKSPKRIASALTSLRILGEKSIPRKDMELFYNSLDKEWKLIIGLLYSTGIRLDEFLHIKWKDFTFNNNKESNIGAEIRIIGKGKKLRNVFIPHKIVNLLKELRPNIKDNDLVFIFKMKDGKIFKRQEKAVYDIIRKLSMKIIGRKINPHMVRHSRFSDLANNSNWDLLSISNLAGHSTTKITEHYIKGAKLMAQNKFKIDSDEL